jgi:hypothetical protein
MRTLFTASLLAATAALASTSVFAGPAPATPQVGVTNIGVSRQSNLVVTVNAPAAGNYEITVQGGARQCTTDVVLVQGANARELPECAEVHTAGGTLTAGLFDENGNQVGSGASRTGNSRLATRGSEKRVAVLNADDRAQLELARLSGATADN